MAVTKANVIACKRVKGGKAGCWIKKKGKTVFRFVNPKTLSGMGIPIVSAAQALKMLPGFSGGGGRTLSRSSLGFSFDGKNCRDSEGKFVPVPQCVKRGLTKGKTAKRKTTRKKTTRKRKR